MGQDYEVAETLGELGQAYEAKGDREKAKKAYDDSISADKRYENTYCWYARLLNATAGDRAKIKSLATEFLKLSPRSDCAAEMQRLSST